MSKKTTEHTEGFYTASFDNSSRFNEYHDERDPAFMAREKANLEAREAGKEDPLTYDVDDSKSPDNESLYRSQKKMEAFENLFGKALEEYNSKCDKQRHSERKMTIKGYYKHCLDVKKNYGDETPIAGSLLVGVGSTDCPLGKWGERIDDPTGLIKDIVTEFLEGFEARNPNMYIWRDDFHVDEKMPPHDHILYIPFASYSGRQGVTLKPSRDRAYMQTLTSRGIKYFNPKTGKEEDWNEKIPAHRKAAVAYWTRAESDEFDRICLLHGVKIEHPDRKKRLEADEETLADLQNQTLEDYKRRKKFEERTRQEIGAEVERDKQSLSEQKTKQLKRQKELDKKEDELDERKRKLDKKDSEQASKATEQDKKDREQASKATEQDKKDREQASKETDLNKRKEALDEREDELEATEQQLDRFLELPAGRDPRTGRRQTYRDLYEQFINRPDERDKNPHPYRPHGSGDDFYK